MAAFRSEKIQQVIVVSLLGVFGVFLVNGLRASGLIGHRAPAAPAPRATPQASQAVSAGGPAPERGQAPTGSSGVTSAPGAVAYGAAGRNPLRPVFLPEPVEPPAMEPQAPEAAEQPKAVPNPAVVEEAIPAHLEGILWSDTKSRAILDGEVYEAGDALGPARIISIGRRGLMIEYQGALFVTWIGAATERNRGRWIPLAAGMARAMPDLGAPGRAPEPQAYPTGHAGQLSR